MNAAQRTQLRLVTSYNRERKARLAISEEMVKMVGLFNSLTSISNKTQTNGSHDLDTIKELVKKAGESFDAFDSINRKLKETE